jgi:flagellar motor switch protein FliG
MATLSPTPIEVVERVICHLNDRLGGPKAARAPSKTGGVKVAANVLNALDKEVSKNVLLSIEERNPELGQTIRNQMFTFEDIGTLDNDTLQKILREVELRALALALKSASQDLRATLLGCISKRAAETVEEEISFMSSVKMREIEEAKKSIVEVIRRLENEGELDLEEARAGG